MMTMKISNLPWTEKYRPINFTSTVLDSYNRQLFENIIENDMFPHLLFYGPPGVGKTTSAENLIHAYRKKHKIGTMENVIHLNASDERGIEVIRNQIFQFIKTNTMFEKGMKFVILDEVDYMTKNAQQALKNMLQNCYDNVRFILICNYICKIEESLKNEFICIRFHSLPKEEIVAFLKKICQEENLKMSELDIRNIQNMFQYDIRSMINFIQLHQDVDVWDEQMFHDGLWAEFHEVILKCSINETKEWLLALLNRSYDLDIHSCITKYANYLIKNCMDCISSDLLNIIECILHNNDTGEYSFEYFIHNIKKQLCKKVEKIEILI